MNIQDKCCTLEQARRLVDLGVKPVAAHYHLPDRVQYGWHRDAVAPAYDVAELGDMFPDRSLYNHPWMVTFRVGPDSIDRDFGNYYVCHVVLDNFNGERISKCRATEAQARASMLILLLETNLMELPEHWEQNPDSLCPDGRCKLSYSPDYEVIRPMPMPTGAETETAAFNAAWQVMKDWIIQAPSYYNGTLEANGRHVKLVLDAVVHLTAPAPEPGK